MNSSRSWTEDDSGIVRLTGFFLISFFYRDRHERRSVAELFVRSRLRPLTGIISGRSGISMILASDVFPHPARDPASNRASAFSPSIQ
jgi:hypothetical protein